MKHHQLLTSSLVSLKQLRDELHNDIDSSKRETLDKVINDLESFGSGITPYELMTALGKGIALIPAFERIVKVFMEL